MLKYVSVESGSVRPHYAIPHRDRKESPALNPHGRFGCGSPGGAVHQRRARPDSESAVGLARSGCES
jgi:hypothetical protein